MTQNYAPTHADAPRPRGSRLAVPAALARVTPAAWGMALVEAAIGYEWLLSALDKILSPSFNAGLAHQVHMAMMGNPNRWWVSLANTLVIPHAQLCALLVQAGELLVALGLFTGAALWIGGWLSGVRRARWLTTGVIVALIGGVFMTANYYLMAGNTLPGLNPSAPFNEGLSLDGLLTLLTVGLLPAHLLALRAPTLANPGDRHRVAPATRGRPRLTARSSNGRAYERPRSTTRGSAPDLRHVQRQGR